MKLEKVEGSSTIDGIGHEDDKMQVLFKAKKVEDQKLYEYWPISHDEFQSIKTAESVMKKLKEIVEQSVPPRNYKKI